MTLSAPSLRPRAITMWDFSWLERLWQVLNPGNAEDSFLLTLEAGNTIIEIEYLNFAAKNLPRWHVAGQFGTAISEGNKFHVRYCDPARLDRLEADAIPASDRTYGIEENLSWTEKIFPWGHWDNCPSFLDSLSAHLTEGTSPQSLQKKCSPNFACWIKSAQRQLAA